MRAKAWALMRASRLRPAPFSATGGAVIAQARLATTGAPACAHRRSVATLFFCKCQCQKHVLRHHVVAVLVHVAHHLGQSGRCGHWNAGRSPAGTLPSRTLPVSLPPSSRHMPSTARAAKPAEGIGIRRRPRRALPQAAGIDCPGTRRAHRGRTARRAGRPASHRIRPSGRRQRHGGLPLHAGQAAGRTGCAPRPRQASGTKS
jgi:hypothetical protein